MLKINLKTIAGLFVAFALFTFASTASAWMASTATKITKTSSSSDVMWLQDTLNAVQSAGLAVDGAYGPKTTGAIRVFQSAHPSAGVADGIAGPKTLAALNAAGANLSPAQNTGALCPNGMTLASNCMTAPGGSPAVALCPNGMTLASNCSVAPGSTGGTLNGPEGNLTSISKLGSYNNTKVSESDTDIAVLGVQVTAKDGSQNIDSFKVALYNSNGSSSKKISKYASNISIWLDGKKIGSKSVSEFSDDANDVYTYRFTGMNGVVPVGQQSKILVALSGVSSMDSTDATNETWSIGAGTVVAGDADFITASSANGRYNDFGPSGITASINFQKAGGASSDQKYKVSTSSTNPLAQTVQVSRTADTSDALLLAFDVKAENGAMKLQRLPVTLTVAAGNADATTGGACATGTATGTTCLPFTAAMVKSLKLYANGVKIADESVPQSGITDAASITVTFGTSSKLQYAIASNATVKFEVKADLNDIEDMTGGTATNVGDFDEGDTVKVDYTTTNVTNTTVELDNANQDSVSNRSGAATGEIQTARSTGGLVTMGTTSYSFTPNTSGSTNNKTIITIPLTIKAFDDTLYVGQTAAAATVGTIANQVGFAYTLNNGTAPSTQVLVIPSGATTAPTSTISSSAPTSGSAWRIDSGSTQTFTIQITLSGATAAASMRVQMQDFQFYTDSALTAGEVIQNLAPMSSFQSVYSPIF